MAFPIKVCAGCGEEFELRPDKPGFANRCPECTAEDQARKEVSKDTKHMTAEERKALSEVNEARRSAIKNLLYRGDN